MHTMFRKGKGKTQQFVDRALITSLPMYGLITVVKIHPIL